MKDETDTGIFKPHVIKSDDEELNRPDLRMT